MKNNCCKHTSVILYIYPCLKEIKWYHAKKKVNHIHDSHLFKSILVRSRYPE